MSAEITSCLDSPLPIPVRLAILLPALAVVVWIATRTVDGPGSWWSRSVIGFMVNPWRDPPVREFERWPDGGLVDSRVPDDLGGGGR